MIEIQKSDREHAFAQAWSYFWYLPTSLYITGRGLCQLLFALFSKSLFPIGKAIFLLLVGQLMSFALPLVALVLAVFGYTVKPK